MPRDAEGVELRDSDNDEPNQPQPTCEGMADVPADDEEVK